MQPGSSKNADEEELIEEDIVNESPYKKNQLGEKRKLRDLNTRLSMYVKTQVYSKKKLEDLMKQLKTQENDFDIRLKNKEIEWKNIQNKLRRENEALHIKIKNIEAENENYLMNVKEYESKFEENESFRNEQMSKIETLTHENDMLKSNLNKLRNEYGSIKYKYENYEKSKNDLMNQIKKLKDQISLLNSDLIKCKTELRNNDETNLLIIKDKNNKINELTQKINNINKNNDAISIKLRSEFDTKIKDFIVKREEQYKQEKTQWMKIFKEEFNRKLRSYKEANYDLSHSNKQLNNDLNDIKSRLSKLKTFKTELEIINRNNEEEIEKLRSDFDELKKAKNDTIKLKNAMINELREKYKSKEIELDEMINIKIQLSHEIDLYRKIMNDAEKEAGYVSPLANASKTKKRKLNTVDDSNKDNKNNENNTFFKKRNILLSSSKQIFRYFSTPGIVRAGKNAKKDFENNIKDDEKDKEYEHNDDDSDDDDNDIDIDINEMDNYETPGNEATPLVFSDMDLNKSKITIKNVSDNDINLTGFSLTNADKSKAYPLPNIILETNDVITIFIGKNINEAEKNNKDNNNFIWENDVWSGQTQDAARLYDPQNKEIARIEIHPDMLPEQTRAHCLIQ